MFTCFYVLAGLHFSVDAVAGAWLAALLYLAVIMFGKWAGAYMGGRLSGTTKRLCGNVSRALLIQAPVAIALIVILDGLNEIGDLSWSRRAMEEINLLTDPEQPSSASIWIVSSRKYDYKHAHHGMTHFFCFVFALLSV